MVGTFDSLGKRPSAAPGLGRPGTWEESLAGYTGLRTHEFVYNLGGNITATGIVPAGSIGTVGTLPRSLTLQTDASGAPRTRMPLPMALVAQFAPAATPVGIHSITLRASGTNQFGEPMQEDITFNQLNGVASAVTAMAKPFHTIAAVQVVAESGTSSSDQVTVDFQFATNPVVGLPIRVRAASDILAVTVEYRSGIVPAANSQLDLGQNAGTGFTVNIKNQTLSLNLGGIPRSDAATEFFSVHIRARSSLGMDQGLRQGDKVVHNW